MSYLVACSSPRFWHSNIAGGVYISSVPCRAPAHTTAASTGLPFLDGLSEERAPAIFALRREHEAFRTMRQVQKEILTTIAQQLSIHPVPTKVSDDGLAYFTTQDKQTSIALQVGMKMSSILHLARAHYHRLFFTARSHLPDYSNVCSLACRLESQRKSSGW